MEEETTLITGKRINLPDDRSVWVGQRDGDVLLQFLNKGEETRLALSLEAALALRNLIMSVTAVDWVINKWDDEDRVQL